MNRFSDSHGIVKMRSKKSKVLNIFMFVMMFALIMIMFNIGITRLTEVNKEQQLESVRNAVVRAVVLYYSIEGRFPPSIEYLTANHNLMIDIDEFIIHYSMFADNVMPHIVVMPRDF